MPHTVSLYIIMIDILEITSKIWKKISIETKQDQY